MSWPPLRAFPSFPEAHSSYCSFCMFCGFIFCFFTAALSLGTWCISLSRAGWLGLMLWDRPLEAHFLTGHLAALLEVL